MTLFVLPALLLFALLIARLLRQWPDMPRPERMTVFLCCLMLGARPLLGNGLFPQQGLFCDLLLILLGIHVVFLNTRIRHQSPIVGRGDIFYLGFLAGIAGSVPLSVNRSASIEQLAAWTAWFVWFWVLRNLPDGLRLRRTLLRVIIVTCGAVLAYALYQYVFGFAAMREYAALHPEAVVNLPGFWRRLHANTVFGPFLYPPALGGYLVMLLPVIICRMAEQFTGPADTADDRARRRWGVGYAVLLAAGIVVLVLTRSKGSWLCAGAAFLIIVRFLPSGIRWGIGGGAVAVAFLTGIAVTMNRTIALPGWHNVAASFNVRYEYAKAAFAMIARRPFLGFGAGAFGTIYPLFKTRLGEETVMAHNSFLQIWAESGLFSLLFFLMFWGTLMHRSYTAIRKKDRPSALVPAGIFAGLCGFLLHNLSDFDVYQGQLNLVAATLAAILVECSRHSDQQLTWHQPLRRSFLLPFHLIIGTLVIMAITLTRALAADYFDARAAYFFRRGDFEKSGQAVTRAIRLYPLPARYFVHRGLAQEAGEANASPSGWATAVAAYRAAIRREPYTADYHYRLGRLLLRHPDKIYVRQGIASLERAAACYPLNPFFRDELAAAYATAGEEDKAVAAKQLAEELKKYYIRGTR